MISIKILLKYSLLLTSILLILPNSIREVPFAFLGLLSIIIYFKEKLYKIKDIYIFSFFLVCSISLIYTSNLKEGFSKIEGLLPVLYLSFSYLVFLRQNIISKQLVKKWIILFNTSNLVFIVIFFVYCYFKITDFSYNNLRTILDTIPLIKIHPIYFSFIGILTILINYRFQSLFKYYYLFIAVGFFEVYLSGVRATFLSFPLLLLLFVLLMKKSKLFKLKFLLITSIFLFSVSLLNKDLIKRFNEIKAPQTFERVNIHNSTSIRYAIWTCAYEQMKTSNKLFGEGIGDVRDMLSTCYKTNYPELEKYYNTHNHYFYIYLTVGLIGLSAFFISLLNIVFISKTKDKQFLYLALFFFLYTFLFENVLERKYGILLFYFTIMFTFNLFLREEDKVIE